MTASPPGTRPDAPPDGGGEPNLRALAHDLRNAIFGVEMNVELLVDVDPTDGSSSSRMRARAMANVRHELERIGAIANSLTALAVSREPADARGAPADGHR